MKMLNIMDFLIYVNNYALKNWKKSEQLKPLL